MRTWSLLVAVVMLCGGLGAQWSLTGGEQVLPKKPFAEFALRMNDRWERRDIPLDQQTLDILDLDDYMMRVYLPQPSDSGDGDRQVKAEWTADVAPVFLYVGYYQSQRTGSTYHSPKHCLPGSGWQFVQSDLVDIQVSATDRITINKVHIRKGFEEQVVLYWYHDRGRVIASEYQAKVYLVWDAITKNRTDGALVRLSVPVSTDVETAYRQGVAFLLDFWPLLLEYMPPGESLS